MTVENDLVSWDDIRMTEARAKQEEATRKTKIALAKIEAKRDVKIARARSTEYLTLRGVFAAFATLALIAVTIAGCEAATDNPQVEMQENEMIQERAELCMKRGGDWVWSNRDGCYRDD
jgi:hypothetical protein